MGMYDIVVIKGGLKYKGKTYEDLQTKDLDCSFDVIEFGKQVPSLKVPPSGIFVFHGYAEEERKENDKLSRKLRKKYNLKDNKENLHKYLTELTKNDSRRLVDFVGILDANHVFSVVLSSDKKEILKKVKSKISKTKVNCISVGELIQILKKYPEDIPVIIQNKDLFYGLREGYNPILKIDYQTVYEVGSLKSENDSHFKDESRNSINKLKAIVLYHNREGNKKINSNTKNKEYKIAKLRDEK